jgi:hypothetical protein
MEMDIARQPPLSIHPLKGFRELHPFHLQLDWWTIIEKMWIF